MELTEIKQGLTREEKIEMLVDFILDTNGGFRIKCAEAVKEKIATEKLLNCEE